MSDAPTQLRAIADELRKEHAEGYLCIFCFDGQIMAKCIADAADEIDRLRAAVERVRAACENDLRWVDAQAILRALEETP